MLKPFYKFKRKGYWHVKLKDEYGKPMTARSTCTKDENEADEISWIWTLELRGKLPQFTPQLTPKGTPFFIPQGAYYARQFTPQVPTEEQGKEYDKMNAFELMSLYWDYARSPYILGFKKQGRRPPEPEAYARALRFIQRLEPQLSRIKVKNVKAEAINDILEKYRQDRNISGTTMRGYSGYLRQAFRYFYKMDLITQDIGDKIINYSLDTRPKSIFTDSELKKLFGGTEYFANDTVKLVSKLLAVTGCRSGELFALQKTDLQETDDGYFLDVSKNLTTDTRRIKCTKTRREDMVYIPKDIAEELKAQMQESSDFLIPNQRTKDAMVYTTVNRSFKAACKKAGIVKSNLTLHSFRHGFIIAARDKGITEEQLLQVTRHESIKGLKTYLNHSSPEVVKKQREIVSFIGELLR